MRASGCFMSDPGEPLGRVVLHQKMSKVIVVLVVVGGNVV